MRILVALAAGLVIGLVLIEALLAGLSILLPEAALTVEAVDGYGGRIAWPLLPVPAVVWLLGSLAGGVMAAAISGRPAWSLSIGVLLAIPAAVIVGMITPGNPMALLAAALPLVGSAAGAAIAARLPDE
jgi:hypothetical protein